MTTGLIRERYSPLELAGRGAQGEVLRARDRVHERTVAIKVRRFEGTAPAADVLAEARALLALPPHPSLPTLREDFVEGDRYHLVMDWVEGESLASALERGALGFEEALRFLGQVAEALDHLHARDPPICHRDVKPANIIISEAGRAVLVDFGITRRPGPGAGTPGYIAPEVLAGDPPTPASDVFSLAVTAAALFTGRAPSFGEPPDLSAVPEALRDRVEAALRRALASSPAVRHPSAGTLVAALRPPPPRTNVPSPLTSFVGRARELADLRRLLEGSRLVTVTGMGGGGKTRLAIEAAREAAPGLPAGVWFVGLAGVREPDLLVQTVADAVGLRDERGADLWERLSTVLGRDYQLVVLDNCEHLLDAVAALATSLLEACPRLRILATSRERIDLAGGAELHLAPLCLPAPNAGPIDASRAEAVALLLDRARDLESQDPEALDAAVRICRTLEGIPLAIEIAAARLRDSRPAELASRLEGQLAALGKAQRGTPARHETLHATLEWSYDLLSRQEQKLFRRLSVFAGGFDAQAVARVCRLGDPGPILGRLADKSLIAAKRTDGTLRFAMLETVRQHAAQLLALAREEEHAGESLALWVLDLVSRETPRLAGPEVAAALATLEQEHGNLRAALALCIPSDRPPGAALQLASGLASFWVLRGHLTEGRRWIEAALASRRPAGGQEARALEGAGALATRQGDYAAAERHLERARELWVSLGNRAGEARALCALALGLAHKADVSAGRACAMRALDIQREIGDEREIARTLSAIAANAMTSDIDQARRLYLESLEISRRLADRPSIAAAVMNLGTLAWRRGDAEEARRLYTEAFEIQQEIGDRTGAARSIIGLGSVAGMQGNIAEARALNERSVALQEELGDNGALARALVNLGNLAFQEGDFEAARRNAVRALDVQPQPPDKLSLANSHLLLGNVGLETRDLALARTQMEQALVIWRELDDRRGVGMALYNLSTADLAAGDLRGAGTNVAEALVELRASGDEAGTALSLLWCGVVLAFLGDAATAVRLMAAGERVLKARRIARFAGDRQQADEAVATARAALGAEFETEWSAGAAMTPEAAVELALRALGSKDGAS